MNNKLNYINDRCPICSAEGQHSFTGCDLLHDVAGQFDYAECSSCGVIYQYPMPTPSDISSFYPNQYEPYRASAGKDCKTFEKNVLRATYGYGHLKSGVPDLLGTIVGKLAYKESIPFTEGGKLLDIGCGGGKFLLSMGKLGWETAGVEFNARACAICHGSGLDVFNGELLEANFADESFDVVTARHVIEHILDPLPFIAEIFRILKPGGLMVLKTPNSNALARNWFGTNWFPNEVPRHLILYSPDNLRLLAKKHGFVECTSFTNTTPKHLLNSWDYLKKNTGRPSRKIKVKRLLASLYVLSASLIGRGDEINSVFEKPI